MHLVALLVLAAVGAAQGLQVLYYAGTGCTGSLLQNVTATNNTCTEYTDGSLKVRCDPYGLDNRLLLYLDSACSVLVTNSTTTTDACADQFLVQGCVPQWSCTTLYAPWSAWSGTCGTITRTRAVASVFSDGLNTSCVPSTPAQLSAQTTTKTCVGLSELGWGDVCNINLQHCSIYPDYPAPFNSIATFLTNSPVFADGWTLFVYGTRQNCTLSNCPQVVYSEPPIVSKLNNITVRSAHSCSHVKLRIISQTTAFRDFASPACGAMLFLGNGVRLQQIDFEVDDDCYDQLQESDSQLQHGAPLQFYGQDAVFTRLRFVNAIVGILLHGARLTGTTTGSLGTVVVDQLEIVSTKQISADYQLAACHGAHVIAFSGNVSVSFASGNTSCVVTVVRPLVPSQLYVTTNGVLRNLNGVSTEVQNESSCPPCPSNTSHFKIYILIGIGILLVFILLNIFVLLHKKWRLPPPYDAHKREN